MTTQINIGDITIHRIVEQEAPFFAALEFFPTLTPALLDENLPWLAPKYIDPHAASWCCASRATSCARRTTPS